MTSLPWARRGRLAPAVSAGILATTLALPTVGAAAAGLAVTLTAAPATGINFGNVTTNTTVPVLFSANLFGSHNTDQSSAYIQGLYHALLGRAAGPVEVQQWLGILGSRQTNQQVALDIAQSPEHRGLELDAYYRNLLHRVESAAERTGWINFFLAGGTELQVVGGFLTSPEYQALHATSASFAAAMYTDLLGRIGSSGELANLTAQLAAGTFTRSQFIDGYLHSQEAYQLAVESFYVAYLHRDALSDPLAGGWVTKIQNGQSLALVQSEILGDPGGEFFQDGGSSVG